MRVPVKGRCSILIGLILVIGAIFHELPVTEASATDDEAQIGSICNSLTGPFCVHTGSLTFFSPYMTPISIASVSEDSNAMYPKSDVVTTARSEEAFIAKEKRCFFQHFASSWMDAGDDANDVMQQKVTTVEECERLCCEHPKCQSFTFWMGHTCFLRATKNKPREDSNSFSGNRIH